MPLAQMHATAAPVGPTLCCDI